MKVRWPGTSPWADCSRMMGQPLKRSSLVYPPNEKLDCPGLHLFSISISSSKVSSRILSTHVPLDSSKEALVNKEVSCCIYYKDPSKQELKSDRSELVLGPFQLWPYRISYPPTPDLLHVQTI